MASISKVDIVGNLPREIAFQVLGKLDDPNNLVRCAKVCQKWRALADTLEVWKQLVDPISLKGRTDITKKEIVEIFDAYRSAESFMANNLGPELSEEEKSERARSDLEDQSSEMIAYANTQYPWL